MDEFLKGPLGSHVVTAGSVVIGGLITWVVAWLYYEKATKDLKAETERLRSMSNLMLLALENSGLTVVVNRDADGTPVSVAGHLSGKVSGASKFQGKLSDGSSQS